MVKNLTFSFILNSEFFNFYKKKKQYEKIIISLICQNEKIQLGVGTGNVKTEEPLKPNFNSYSSLFYYGFHFCPQLFNASLICFIPRLENDRGQAGFWRCISYRGTVILPKQSLQSKKDFKIFDRENSYFIKQLSKVEDLTHFNCTEYNLALNVDWM
ncbi:hypothetical protein BpHYR1_050900 [Brachionus plicatilis]|uniref:Uncharacterized protein n=1 Tax=Brachionus plicatilis TaxID=10195 RepID=A0A3M7RJZ1_BRAPC|nr:hypothetical protein BpHYR1_050900 [Brachionus plicatilis]